MERKSGKEARSGKEEAARKRSRSPQKELKPPKVPKTSETREHRGSKSEAKEPKSSKGPGKAALSREEQLRTVDLTVGLGPLRAPPKASHPDPPPKKKRPTEPSQPAKPPKDPSKHPKELSKPLKEPAKEDEAPKTKKHKRERQEEPKSKPREEKAAKTEKSRRHEKSPEKPERSEKKSKKDLPAPDNSATQEKKHKTGSKDKSSRLEKEPKEAPKDQEASKTAKPKASNDQEGSKTSKLKSSKDQGASKTKTPKPSSEPSKTSSPLAALSDSPPVPHLPPAVSPPAFPSLGLMAPPSPDFPLPAPSPPPLPGTGLADASQPPSLDGEAVKTEPQAVEREPKKEPEVAKEPEVEKPVKEKRGSRKRGSERGSEERILPPLPPLPEGCANAYLERQRMKERLQREIDEYEEQEPERWEAPARTEGRVREALASLGVHEDGPHKDLFRRVLSCDDNSFARLELSAASLASAAQSNGKGPASDHPAGPLHLTVSAQPRGYQRLARQPDGTEVKEEPRSSSSSPALDLTLSDGSDEEAGALVATGSWEEAATATAAQRATVLQHHRHRHYASFKSVALSSERVQASSCRAVAVLGVALCGGCAAAVEKTAYDADVQCMFRRIRRLRFDRVGRAEVSGWQRAEDVVPEKELAKRPDFLPSATAASTLGWSRTEAGYVLQNLAAPLRSLVRQELAFLDAVGESRRYTMGIYRGGELHRELCDGCAATIFNLHLLCTACGTVLCPDCVREAQGKMKPLPLCEATRAAHSLEKEGLELAQLLPDPFPDHCGTLLALERRMDEAMCRHSVPSACSCEAAAAACLCAAVSAAATYAPRRRTDEGHHGPHQGPPREAEEEPVSDSEDDGRDWAGLAGPPARGPLAEPCEEGSELRRQSERHDTYLVLHGLSEPPMHLFQKHWRSGEPVLVTNIHKLMPWSRWRRMWNHKRLAKKQIGEDSRGQIIDCIVHQKTRLKPRVFWDGYGEFNLRASAYKISEYGQQVPTHVMHLKFKDYPSHDSFKNALQSQFHAYCATIPLPKYSAPQGVAEDGPHSDDPHKRDRGKFNLVRALPPKLYVVPDLGPKMYTAYGMLEKAAMNKGSTNLHCDISDAVNVMVDTTVPRGKVDHQGKVMTSEAWHQMEIQRKLVLEDITGAEAERLMSRWWEAGALWTIWSPDETLKLKRWMRDHEAKVKEATRIGEPDRRRMALAGLGVEEGAVEAWTNMDHPIHDQSVYLTAKLRSQAERNGVKGFTFVQCLGDAVFIPAGAAHQVQNLLSCVKMAEDFVTPEGVAKCADIGKECRRLSLSHANKEDRVQLNSIVYHSVKEAVSTLLKANS